MATKIFIQVKSIKSRRVLKIWKWNKLWNLKPCLQIKYVVTADEHDSLTCQLIPRSRPRIGSPCFASSGRPQRCTRRHRCRNAAGSQLGNERPQQHLTRPLESKMRFLRWFKCSNWLAHHPTCIVEIEWTSMKSILMIKVTFNQDLIVVSKKYRKPC